MPTEENIVRAVFLSDPRGEEHGRRYHYNVPGAKIGSLVTGPGKTGPARVVALGCAKGWPHPVATGSFWKGKVTDTAQTVNSFSEAMKETMADMSYDINRQLYDSSPLLEAIIPIKKGKNMSMTIEEHEAEAKRLRKAEKARAKREAAAKQERKDRARRRQLALDTLENIANGSNVRNAQVRMQAARALLRDS